MTAVKLCNILLTGFAEKASVLLQKQCLAFVLMQKRHLVDKRKK